MKRTRREATSPVKDFVVLSNDPSFRGWGWVIMQGDRVLDAGCIKTEAKDKKLRIRKGDDDVRRAHEIVDILLSAIETYRVSFIVTELPHGSQVAAGAKVIGVVIGMLVATSKTLNIPVEWYGEGDAKKALLGKTSATKQEVINAITEKYNVPWSGVKYKDEAIADAMAIYHVASEISPMVQFFKRHGRTI